MMNDSIINAEMNEMSNTMSRAERRRAEKEAKKKAQYEKSGFMNQAERISGTPKQSNFEDRGTDIEGTIEIIQDMLNENLQVAIYLMPFASESMARRALSVGGEIGLMSSGLSTSMLYVHPAAGVYLHMGDYKKDQLDIIPIASLAMHLKTAHEEGFSMIAISDGKDSIEDTREKVESTEWTVKAMGYSKYGIGEGMTLKRLEEIMERSNLYKEIGAECLYCELDPKTGYNLNSQYNMIGGDTNLSIEKLLKVYGLGN